MIRRPGRVSGVSSPVPATTEMPARPMSNASAAIAAGEPRLFAMMTLLVPWTVATRLPARARTRRTTSSVRSTLPVGTLFARVLVACFTPSLVSRSATEISARFPMSATSLRTVIAGRCRIVMTGTRAPWISATGLRRGAATTPTSPAMTATPAPWIPATRPLAVFINSFRARAMMPRSAQRAIHAPTGSAGARR